MEKYLNNATLRREIALSKATYCQLVDRAKHALPHAICLSKDEVTPEFITDVLAYHASTWRGGVQLRPEDLVIRVMSYDHVPLDPKQRAYRGGTRYVATPFRPFSHFVLDANGELIEVGRAFWRGDFWLGEFTTTRGRMTDNLGRSLLTLIERYSKRGNFRRYSYLDEMAGRAMLATVAGALKFDETKSDNPFSYLSQIVGNAFLKELSEAKAIQDFRKAALIEAGLFEWRGEGSADASRPMPGRVGAKA